jgi:hypothetical protein
MTKEHPIPEKKPMINFWSSAALFCVSVVIVVVVNIAVVVVTGISAFKILKLISVLKHVLAK